LDAGKARLGFEPLACRPWELGELAQAAFGLAAAVEALQGRVDSAGLPVRICALPGAEEGLRAALRRWGDEYLEVQNREDGSANKK